MFTHVLTPVDGSELSMGAARHGIELAKLCNAKLTAIMVSHSYKRIHDEGFAAPAVREVRERWEEQVSGRAQAVLDKICMESGRVGVLCNSVHVFHDAPYEAIIQTAKRDACDVVVMGSHGYGGLKQFLLGSETTRLLSHSTIPVVVYR